MGRGGRRGSLKWALLPRLFLGEQTSSTGNYSTYYTTNVKGKKRMAEIFGDRLRAVRLQAGKQQVQVAWESGIPVSQISHYESGTREPNLINLRRLCLALDVSADLLLGLHLALENRMEMMEMRMQSLETEITNAVAVSSEDGGDTRLDRD